MVANLRLCKIFWTLTTSIALIAALGGIVFRDLYQGLFPPAFMPGALPQDIFTVLVCLLLFFLIATVKQTGIVQQVVIIGLIGSFFYTYGIFTIERVYNGFYLAYAAVFALSFWTTGYALSGLRADRLPGIRVPDGVRKLTAWSSIAIAVLFTFLWSAALVPIMQQRDRIEYLYSIYILDLCFIMPAFFITAVMALRRMPLGILMGPALMILGFFVIFPLGLNELAKPSWGMPLEIGPMAMSFTFAAFMLLVAYLHLKRMQAE